MFLLLPRASACALLSISARRRRGLTRVAFTTDFPLSLPAKILLPNLWGGWERRGKFTDLHSWYSFFPFPPYTYGLHCTYYSTVYCAVFLTNFFHNKSILYPCWNLSCPPSFPVSWKIGKRNLSIPREIKRIFRFFLPSELEVRCTNTWNIHCVYASLTIWILVLSLSVTRNVLLLRKCVTRAWKSNLIELRRYVLRALK